MKFLLSPTVHAGQHFITTFSLTNLRVRRTSLSTLVQLRSSGNSVLRKQEVSKLQVNKFFLMLLPSPPIQVSYVDQRLYCNLFSKRICKRARYLGIRVRRETWLRSKMKSTMLLVRK